MIFLPVLDLKQNCSEIYNNKFKKKNFMEIHIKGNTAEMYNIFYNILSTFKLTDL